MLSFGQSCRLLTARSLRIRTGIGARVEKIRLLLRLLLWTKRAIPTDSNYGFDYDSAALVKSTVLEIESMFFLKDADLVSCLTAVLDFEFLNILKIVKRNIKNEI